MLQLEIIPIFDMNAPHKTNALLVNLKSNQTTNYKRFVVLDFATWCDSQGGYNFKSLIFITLDTWQYGIHCLVCHLCWHKATIHKSLWVILEPTKDFPHILTPPTNITFDLIWISTSITFTVKIWRKPISNLFILPQNWNCIDSLPLCKCVSSGAEVIRGDISLYLTSECC